MKADVGRRTMLGARAHCERHSPGQRPNIEALVRWQSQASERMGGGGRFTTSAPGDATVSAEAMRALQQVVRRGLAVRPDAPDAIRALDPSALAWLAPEPSQTTRCVGSFRLCAGLSDDVEWIDLALSVHVGGRWIALAVELVDDATAADGAPRSWIVLDETEAAALAAIGIEPSALAGAAARAGAARWVYRQEGLGAFVAGLVDLGWPKT